MPIDDAAAAAARARAEAQRRAEEARRRAAAQAKEQARAAAAAAKKKVATPRQKPVSKNDEFSTGAAKALRLKDLGSRPTSLGRDIEKPMSEPPKPLTVAQQGSVEASRIRTQAQTDPQGAAKSLQKALANAKPAFRAAVLKEAGDVVQSIAASLKNADDKTRVATLGTLGKVVHTLTPEQSRALGEHFARGLDGADLGGTRELLGGLTLPKGGLGFGLLKELGSHAGVGDFMRGLSDGARATGNEKLGHDVDAIRAFNAKASVDQFKKAKETVDRLNGELNSLVQGFGRGAKNPEALKKAIADFKERHKKEYAEYEAAAAGVTNMLADAPAVLASKDLGKTLPYLEALKLAPQVLATKAGQAALGDALQAQAKGEPSILDTLKTLSQGDDGKDLRQSLGPVLSQALGTRATELKAQGRLDEAHALVGTLGKNAELFDLKPGQLDQVQGALGEVLDGTPGALESLNLAVGSVSALLPENSKALPALKGLGFVVGVAGLPGNLAGLSDAELQTQIGTVASTLGLGADGGSLAIKSLTSGQGLASLDKLFGRVSAGAGIIGAVTGIIDFGKTVDGGGSVGDITVSGLSAASGVLLCIPGGQLAGVGLAIASFALQAFLGNRRAEEAEHASEKDAKQFLLDAGLNDDFASVFSNLNDDKQNIGPFVERVAKKLGLTQAQFFEKLNASSGEDRKKLLFTFAKLSLAGELIDDLPVFGPDVKPDDLKKVSILSKEDRERIAAKLNGARDAFAKKTADDIKDLLD